MRPQVVMGQKGNGVCFKAEGLYNGDGVAMAMPSEHIFFATSSVMLHDPWSIPFAKDKVCLGAPHQMHHADT
jgi:hypothetical protein